MFYMQDTKQAVDCAVATNNDDEDDDDDEGTDGNGVQGDGRQGFSPTHKVKSNKDLKLKYPYDKHISVTIRIQCLKEEQSDPKWKGRVLMPKSSVIAARPVGMSA